jgi:lipopolysaccharide transport system permease protein
MARNSQARPGLPLSPAKASGHGTDVTASPIARCERPDLPPLWACKNKGLMQDRFAEVLWDDVWAGFSLWRLWGMLGWDDIRQRYRRSVLGPFWITLSMGVFIFVLGIIYARLFKVDVSTYLPFLSAGFITWGFISQTANEACRAFLDGERIIKQIKLPYMIYVLRLVYRNFIVFLHTIVIFIPVALFFQVKFGLVTLLALPGLAMVYYSQIWMTVILGILGTRYRDLAPIIVTATQIMMFATPIMWPIENLGDSTLIATINPLYHLLEIVRAPLLGSSPPLLSWLVSIGVATVGSLIAFALLVRSERRLVFWL